MGLLIGWLKGFEGHQRSFVKAVSWRVTGSVDTFVLGYIISGRASLAGSIAATEFLTKILLYYFHERIWAVIQWGHRRELAQERSPISSMSCAGNSSS